MHLTFTAQERAALELAAANLTSTQRDKMSGTAMDDKSYPIPTVAYLRKAIMSFGRAPVSKRPALVAHIRDRAKALGASDLDWVKNFLAKHSSS